METNKLLPCPFCGEKGRLYKISQYLYNAYCPRCNVGFYCWARSKGYSLWLSRNWKEDAIEEWNNRVYPKDVQEAIERDKPRKGIQKRLEEFVKLPAHCGDLSDI